MSIYELVKDIDIEKEENTLKELSQTERDEFNEKLRKIVRFYISTQPFRKYDFKRDGNVDHFVSLNEIDGLYITFWKNKDNAPRPNKHNKLDK